jgi:hypothetical protein
MAYDWRTALDEYVSYTFRAFSRLYDRTGGELRLKRFEEVYR